MFLRILYLKKFIPKKARYFLHKLYFNNFVTRIENFFFKDQIKFNDLILSDPKKIIPYFTRSYIRHGLYEKYEFDAAKKLDFCDNNIIDLGSSLGLLSLSLAIHSEDKKYILVEPSKDLLDFSETIFTKHSKNIHYFINKAIDYSSDDIFFNKKATLSGFINNLSGNKVEKTNISELLKQSGIKEFNLIVDIEGKSFEPLFFEPESLINCKKIIIEEDFTNKYTKEIVFKKFNELGFTIKYHEVSRRHNIFGLERSSFDKK